MFVKDLLSYNFIFDKMNNKGQDRSKKKTQTTLIVCPLWDYHPISVSFFESDSIEKLSYMLRFRINCEKDREKIPSIIYNLNQR